jgi:hypothetical protein
VRAFVLSRDLIMASRIEEAARRASVEFSRVDGPDDIPVVDEAMVVFVNWAEREPGWGHALSDWQLRASGRTDARLVLFGPHTELEGHAEARRHGIGPVFARSQLAMTPERWFASLP